MCADTYSPSQREGVGNLLYTRNCFGDKQSDFLTVRNLNILAHLDNFPAPTSVYRSEDGSRRALYLFTVVAALEGAISEKAGRAPNPWVFKENHLDFHRGST